jgi:hypothetical protein
MSTATDTDRRVTPFRRAVTKAGKADRQAERLTQVIEHLECWSAARASTLHDGAKAVYVLVEQARPVRLPAAKDIATTCPFYVAGMGEGVE